MWFVSPSPYAIVPGVPLGRTSANGKRRTFTPVPTPFGAAIAGMLFAAIPGTGSLAQTVTLQ